MSYRRWSAPSLACVLGGLLLLAAACETNLPIVGASPTSVALQASDLPSDLVRCASSGDINSYLKDLKAKNPDAYNGTLDAWNKLKAQGASGAAIVSFAADPSACTGEMGTGRGRTAATFVIEYKDDKSAIASWQKGILGFPTPDQNQQTPGLKVGVATGLGRNSWSLDEAQGGRSLYLAFWQNQRFDVFFLAEDLNHEETQKSLDGVQGRVR